MSSIKSNIIVPLGWKTVIDESQFIDFQSCVRHFGKLSASLDLELSDSDTRVF